MMPAAPTYALLCFRGCAGVPLSPLSGVAGEGSYQDYSWLGLSKAWVYDSLGAQSWVEGWT